MPSFCPSLAAWHDREPDAIARPGCMTIRVAGRPPSCPHCGGLRVDEYTHYECPPDIAPEHRHWGCATCDHEWIDGAAPSGFSS